MSSRVSLVVSWRPGGVPRHDAREAARRWAVSNGARLLSGGSVRMFGCSSAVFLHNCVIYVRLWQENTENIHTNNNGDSDNSSGTMSKVQGGMKCVKYLLFVFNFIFWVSLGILIGWSFFFLYNCNIWEHSVFTSFALLCLSRAPMFRWSQMVAIAVFLQTVFCRSPVLTFSSLQILYVCCIYL